LHCGFVLAVRKLASHGKTPYEASEALIAALLGESPKYPMAGLYTDPESISLGKVEIAGEALGDIGFLSRVMTAGISSAGLSSWSAFTHRHFPLFKYQKPYRLLPGRLNRDSDRDGVHDEVIWSVSSMLPKPPSNWTRHK